MSVRERMREQYSVTRAKELKFERHLSLLAQDIRYTIKLRKEGNERRNSRYKGQ